MFSSLRNYYLRSGRASFPEMVYRAKQAAQTVRLRRVLGNGDLHLQVPGPTNGRTRLPSIPSFQIGAQKETFQSILEGRVFTLNSDPEEVAQFNHRFSHTFFYDVPSSGSSPDIRAVWEPARLQHFTHLLAKGAELSGDMRDFVRTSLMEWIEENPFLRGPAYMSAMECGLRIPVLFYTLKLCNSFSSDEQRLLLETIYQHAWWVSKRLSLYSSLGNHTVSECVGLVFGGAIFGEAQEGTNWLETGIGLLEQEAEHQILGDGGPAEQSLNYHRFVLDLYWLAVDFVEKNGLYDFGKIKPRLLAGERFLRTFEDCYGRLPAIGDSDEGRAIAPGVSPAKPPLDLEPPKLSVFKETGYTVIRPDTRILLTFDHGPLGMPPLYNHGHADALSVTLSRGGKPILVDPGTYRYNGEPEYRKYFKGTRAHNTLTIDDLDQAVQETGFIWSHPYHAEILHVSEESEALSVAAVHDGYARLKEPVWHQRIVLYEGNTIIVKDRFSGKGTHHYELNFHLHPDASITRQGGWWVIRMGDAVTLMRLKGEKDFELVRGRNDPIFGWYSPAYGIKVETNVLTCRKTGRPDEVEFTTVIRTGSQIL